MRKKGTVIWLLFAIVWAGIIFLFSSQSYSDSNGLSSSLASFLTGLLIPDFASWGPSLQADWLNSINNLLRKLAHFSEFCLLGVLTYLAALNLMGRRNRKRPPTKFGVGMVCFYICAVLAALDELHQSMSAGRTPSTGDMLVDCAGAILGIIICAYKTSLPGAVPRPKPTTRRRR